MKKYALCIIFGVLFGFSCAENAMAKISFQDWKTNYELLGRKRPSF